MARSDRIAIRKFFERSLSSPIDRIAVISAPAPKVSAMTALRILAGSDAFCWHPPTGRAVIGSGITAELKLSGADRLEQLAQKAERLFSDVEVHSFPGVEPPTPLLFGGLSFTVGDQGERWAEFGEGRFVLPRWSYQRSGEEAFLSLAISATEPERTSALAEFDRLWAALEDPPVNPVKSPAGARELRVEHLDPAIWNRDIKEIRTRISSGDYEKVVAARSSRVFSDQPFDDLEVLDRMSGLYPGCHRILFRRQNASFLGAPPETLFEKRGAEVHTHALAGSVRIHPDLTPEEAGQALLRSPKNREEHAVVVREVLSLLRPLTESADHLETPQVMRLRNLLHLESPIRARLLPGVSAVTLLDVLHPTPAVAGWPRAEAVRWIAAHEEPRGWYAGPVGWLDARGDGVFAVAIRSALIRDRCAHAFAGAGIMHDSDPPMEYGETAVKLEAMLRALGVDASR